MTNNSDSRDNNEQTWISGGREEYIPVRENKKPQRNIWLVSSLYKKIVKRDRRPWSCVFGWHHWKVDMSNLAHTADCVEPDCDAWDWG